MNQMKFYEVEMKFYHKEMIKVDQDYQENVFRNKRLWTEEDHRDWIWGVANFGVTKIELSQPDRLKELSTRSTEIIT